MERWRGLRKHSGIHPFAYIDKIELDNPTHAFIFVGERRRLPKAKLRPRRGWRFADRSCDGDWETGT